MKTILCFGDSNTFGLKPDGINRYEESERWTGILRERTKDLGIKIIDEGLVGRTTVFEDSLRPGRKGIDFLYPLLESHRPDELILMLGTNDCKTHYKASAQVIGLGIERLLKEARKYSENLEILLLSPIHLGDEVWRDNFDPEFSQESVLVSKQLKEVYKNIAVRYNCKFLAASDIANPSKEDEEHLTKDGHRDLANSIFEVINN